MDRTKWVDEAIRAPSPKDEAGISWWANLDRQQFQQTAQQHVTRMSRSVAGRRLKMIDNGIDG